MNTTHHAVRERQDGEGAGAVQNPEARLRTRKVDVPFVQLSNRVAQDASLSLEAKGMLLYLRSLPNDWVFSVDRIAKAVGVSRPTASKIVRDLESRGLLSRRKVHARKTEYAIGFDYEGERILPPGEGKNFAGQKFCPPTNKQNTNKETENQGDAAASREVAEVILAFSKINPAASAFYRNTTQRRACRDLIEAHGFERVLRVATETLPLTNRAKYLPTVTTPLQLHEKWAALEAAIAKAKGKALDAKPFILV